MVGNPLPTSLRARASLTHIRRYLGQVSDRMAEHYVYLTSDDLENVLQHVWVAGLDTAHPGELLAGDATPLSREQAQALAIDGLEKALAGLGLLGDALALDLRKPYATPSAVHPPRSPAGARSHLRAQGPGC